MKKLILTFTLVLLSVAFLTADVYIKQQTKTSAAMGQPAKDQISEQWYAGGKFAVISPDGSFIVNTKEKKFYIINHKSKTYVVTGLPVDMTSLMPAQMAQMMKGMMDSMNVTVTPNGKTKKILKWDAAGYDLSMKMMGMDMKMTFWASKDVPFDWKGLKEASSEFYAASMRGGQKFMDEFKKIDGYPLAMDMSMMGMNVSMTTLEISKKDPPAGVYSFPAGYTKKEKLDMADMKR